ncbi:MAG: hypothetical protein ACRBCI_06310 [Cellvibrionaceae bacterium]
MKTETVKKPDSIHEETWADNKRWLKLMTDQASQNQNNKDPNLYRQSSRNRLIIPPTFDEE